jgi:hypothetical protein
MSGMKYDAIGLGMSDLVMGPAFFEKAAANKLTILDASPLANKQAVPYVVKNVDGVRVGIISFSSFPKDAKVNEYELRKSRFETFKELRSKCDLMIVLDEDGVTTDEWLQRNSVRLGSPDIVIPGQWRTISEEQVVGSTHIMPPHFQSKQLGVVDLEYSPGQPVKVTNNSVNLDEKFPEDKQVADQVAKGILAMGLVPQEMPVAQMSHTPDVKPYYSPLLCKACHQKQYDDWSKTKCLPCHSELYRATEKYMVTQTPYAGVECATCHMNSLPHGLERKDVAVHVKVDPQLCVGCHTKERSPSYDEKTYFPKVAHAGVAPATTASRPN